MMEKETSINKNKKKLKRVQSDAFPPSKFGYRDKNPSFSNVHKKLINIEIKKENISYRELVKDDIEEVILLHKEWFPIDYPEEFFNKHFEEDKKEKQFFTLASVYNHNGEEFIVGIILCELRTEEEFRQLVPEESLCNIDISFLEDLNIFKPDYEFAYIMTIGVIDECRQMNLGTKLLDKLIYKMMLRPNCLAIYLHVVCYNKSAISFYKKNNFIEVTTLKNYYYINDNRYDSDVFVKFLNGQEKQLAISKNINSFTEYFLKKIAIVFKLILFILSMGFFFRCCRRQHKLD